jgi:hypothetical protein
MREVNYHTVPERVPTVRLDGSVEFETSDGEVRQVPAGGFVLAEDTHGRGHISRHSAEQAVAALTGAPAFLAEATAFAGAGAFFVATAGSFAGGIPISFENFPGRPPARAFPDNRAGTSFPRFDPPLFSALSNLPTGHACMRKVSKFSTSA